jgi:hypothetical protein
VELGTEGRSRRRSCNCCGELDDGGKREGRRGTVTKGTVGERRKEETDQILYLEQRAGEQEEEGNKGWLRCWMYHVLRTDAWYQTIHSLTWMAHMASFVIRLTAGCRLY